MSVTFSFTPHPPQTAKDSYYIARIARGKLQDEAARPGHRLHVLVCHANMLDSLILGISKEKAQQNLIFDRLFTRDEGQRPSVPEQHEKYMKEVYPVSVSEDEESEDEGDDGEDCGCCQADGLQPSCTDEDDFQERREEGELADCDDEPLYKLSRTVSWKDKDTQASQINPRTDGEITQPRVALLANTYTQGAIGYLMTSIKIPQGALSEPPRQKTDSLSLVQFR